MEENNARNIAVQKCIETLQRARTDNEKFAALLLIANAEKIYKFSAEERKLVYGSIEFKFVWRLLNSKKDPEGCEKGMLLSIGLTIFSCMVKEMAVLDQTENIEAAKCIGRLLEIINASHPKKRHDGNSEESVEKEMVDNCFQILNVFAKDLPSSERILEMGMRCFLEATKGEKVTEIGIQSAMLVCQCLNTRKTNKNEVLKDYADSLKLFINNLSHPFAVAQNEEKFTLLEILVNMIGNIKENKMLNTSEQSPIPSSKYLQKMRTGLMDILQSKVNEKYRHLALKLSAEMIEVYGLEWTYFKYEDEQEKYSKKFLLLLMSLVSVEINMFFYDRKEDCNILSTLFSITENVIEAMSDFGDRTSSKTDLTSEIISKLLHTINNVVTVIIAYLDDFKDSGDVEGACMNVKIIACMRLLCAYMSEETSAMKKEILKLEPFLLKLAKASYTVNKKDMLERIAAQDESAEENSPNIFNFLLPVLCHWSADDKTRKVLLDEDIHITLWEYLEKLLCCHPTKSIVYQSLETVFGIFLNIAITEAELAANSSSVFAEILVFLMTKLNQFSSMPANLVMNMVTLSLILARAQVKIHQKNKEGIERFFQMILKMLCDSCPYLQQENTSTKQINWSDISELWLIGIDNTIACIDLYPGLSEVLKTHSAFQAIVKFLERKKVVKTDDFKSVSLIATNFVKKVM